MKLWEKYRPTSMEGVLGHDKAKRIIDVLRRQNALKGAVLWITGESGTGKTTIARIVASEVSDSFLTEEVNGQDVTLDMVRRWEEDCRFVPMAQPGKGYCVIVNEAHKLSSRVVTRLLTTLETPCVQRNCTWIFTTTTDGGVLFEENLDAVPFASRATELPLSRRMGAEEVAEYARTIAVKEGLDGQPIAKYVRLAKDKRNNVRAVLDHIGAGGMLE